MHKGAKAVKLIVQKFGGTSVANSDRVKNIAKIITNTYDQGYHVIVVVSAQGDTTDNLISKVSQINKHPSPREMDVLLSTGEQISIALVTMAIHNLGYPAISLTGWQGGFLTDSSHQNARIQTLDTTRLYNELAKHSIIVVAGFQGIDENNNITTLGRGGSDTSAVALAASLRADICQIYTDIDGVYTADPRLVKNARRINEITFDQMLEMSSLGAKILHNRSVEIAKKHGIQIDVLSSLVKQPGTRVKEVIKVEKELITGITLDNDISMITIKSTPSTPPSTIFELLSNEKIIISNISYVSILNNTNHIHFTVATYQKEQVMDILQNNNIDLGLEEISFTDNISKVSLVGTGISSNYNITYKLFSVLRKNDIQPILISTSELAISIIINKKKSLAAMNIIHDEFNLGEMNESE